MQEYLQTSKVLVIPLGPPSELTSNLSVASNMKENNLSIA